MKQIIKNPYFWIIVFLVGLGICIFFTLGIKIVNEKTGYLLISDITSYQCSNDNTCKNVTNTDILEEEEKQEFIVYQNNQYLGEYKVDYINKWNFFDANNQWVNIQDSFIAGSKNTELVIKEYETRTMNQEETVLLNKILKENNINTYSSLDQNEVLEYDFDKDGNKDKIILASNVTEESEDKQLFTIVIAVVKNKTSILHIDVYGQYENYLVPAYNIKNIINLFNNKEDYFVLLKGYFSEVGEPTSYIYKVNNKTFASIVSEE